MFPGLICSLDAGFRCTSWKWDRGAGRYTKPGVHLLLLIFNVITPHIFPATWHRYLTIISHIPHFKYSYTAPVHVTDCPLTHFVRGISPTVGTLARLDFVSRATVVVQASIVRPLTQLSQKPLHGSKPEVIESYPSTIFPDIYFSFFKIFTFHTNFVFVFVNMGPRESKNFKMLFLSSFHLI